MGWLFQSTPLRDETPAQVLARRFTHEDERTVATVLATATVRGTVYAAIRNTDKQAGTAYVFCGVFLVRNNVCDGFGYKAMDESMGPLEADCPGRILRLLSPVEAISNPGSAASWRERVARRRLERAGDRHRTAALVPGRLLRTARPLRFGTVEADLFRVVPSPPRRRGPVFVALPHGFRCRLRPEHIRDAALLPAEDGHGEAGPAATDRNADMREREDV